MNFRVALSMQGLPRDRGQVRLSVFLSELQLFAAALKKFDAHVSGGVPANLFRIVELSYSSPATVAVEAFPENSNRDTRDALSSEIISTLDAIQQGEILEGIPYDLLSDLNNMARAVGKRAKSVSLSSNGRTFELSKSFSSNITSFLDREEFCEGIVEGSMDQINVHAGLNVFVIYPRVGPSKIRCHFGHDLLETAKSAIGKDVLVSGQLRYLPNAPFPHAVDVRDIEIYPPESELPTFEDLRGLAPQATGAKRSEQFIADLRDAWE